MEIQNITYDPVRLVIYKGEEQLDLTLQELRLLLLLAKEKRPVPRSEIIKKAWPGRVVAERTIDVFINRLKTKIGHEYIVWVHGLGFKFVGKITFLQREIALLGSARNDSKN